MAVTDVIELDLMLNRFNRLVGEMIRGSIKRNSFQPWEVDLLLDMEKCELPARRRVEILRQYQRAVERQLETGFGPPMRLSKFLEIRARRRESLPNPTAPVGLQSERPG